MNDTSHWEERERFVRFSPGGSLIEVEDGIYVHHAEIERVANLIRHAKTVFPDRDSRLHEAGRELLDTIADRVLGLTDLEDEE